jgi:homoserine dehydrogenase
LRCYHRIVNGNDKENKMPSDTALGGLKGSDSFFEIYTESYGDRPTNSGAAGSAVTARGVLAIF